MKFLSKSPITTIFGIVAAAGAAITANQYDFDPEIVTVGKVLAVIGTVGLGIFSADKGAKDVKSQPVEGKNEVEDYG